MKLRATFNKYVADGSPRKAVQAITTGLGMARDKALQGAGFIVGLSEVGLDSGSDAVRKISEEANKGRVIAKALAQSSNKRGATYREEPPHPVQSDMFKDL